MIAHVQGQNRQIVSSTIDWDGTKKTNTVFIPVADLTPVMIVIDNSKNNDQDLTVTLEHKMPYGEDVYASASNALGDTISLTVPKTVNKAFGPFEGFPLFAGGRITLTATVAPTAGTKTVITVQEL